MEKTNYISEVKHPSFAFSDTTNLSQMDKEWEGYLLKLEGLRLSFLESLSSCRENVALAYLDELVNVRKVLKDTLDGCIRPDAPTPFFTLNVPNKREFLWALLESVEKTIDFARTIGPQVPDTKVELVTPKKEKLVEPVRNRNNGVENTMKNDSEKRTNDGWYNVDEVCERFRLPKNNIKSRKWREQNGFPTHQDGAYCRVKFSGSEVEAWLLKH